MENKESKIGESEQSEGMKDSEQGYLRLLFPLLYVVFEVFLTLFQEVFKAKY